MPATSSRRRSFFLFFALASILFIGRVLYARLQPQEKRETTTVARGVTVLAVSTQTLNGPLHYWMVKAEKSATQISIEVADGRDVNKKRPVRALASQANALVAINGGFFAYDGAAVGAVKVDGEWHRLPWKSRTALGWSENDAQIAPLSKSCELRVSLQDGTFDTYNAALNGFAPSGTHTPLVDGFCVLTRRFAQKIRLKKNQTALLVQQNRVTQRNLSGEISWPADSGPNDFFVILNGKATLDKPVKEVSWKVIPGDSDLNRFPHILGAGPRLVQNGQVKTTEIEEEFRPDVIERGPRTAVGLDAKGNWILLVVDGRQAASVGLTIPETARLLQQLGAVQALNLDGGSSTQLVIKGELINAPSGYDPVNPLRAREVSVSNALIWKPR